MNILLISIGTRGDIEPFLAIAELLDKNGHKVTCCFPSQLGKLVDNKNINFVPLSPQFLELIDSKEGKIAMGSKANILAKIRAYFILYKKNKIINKLLSKQQKEVIDKLNPDKVLFHIKSSYPLIHEVLNPGKTILISPIPYMVHTVNEHPHIGLPNWGKYFNKLSYKLANFGVLKNIENGAKGLYNKKEISANKILTTLHNTETIYTVSPYLFNRPTYWKENINILGYHERNKTLNWTPDATLLKFIKNNSNILFVTFGSMVNANPEEKTKIILATVEKLNIPTIINTADGGLIIPKKYNSNLIHFVNRTPYDWLLPQVSHMVHHGGSGTTHMAIKYGCSSLIIPHIIDQYLWNKINNNKGLGPKGIAISKLTEKNFTPLLEDLIQNKSYKEKAIEASKALKSEDFKEILYKKITV